MYDLVCLHSIEGATKNGWIWWAWAKGLWEGKYHKHLAREYDKGQ